MAQTHPYSQGIFDLTSVLIVVLWIGLWFLWPSLNAWTIRAKAMPEPRVSFYPRQANENRRDYAQSLMLFGRGQEARDDGAGAVLGSLLRQPERAPRYLERGAGADGLLNGAVAAPAAPQVDMGTYRPTWKDEQVFSIRPTPREMQLFSETAGDLRKQGFEVPSFTDEEMKQFDKPWQVVVYVEVDESGRATHVLLQTGCEYPRINAMVVKAMYRGKVPTPGAPCSGRVVLNYGRP